MENKITASQPSNIRRYGNHVYCTRTILVNGQAAYMWENWARGWAEDWKRIKCGNFSSCRNSGLQ